MNDQNDDQNWASTFLVAWQECTKRHGEWAVATSETIGRAFQAAHDEMRAQLPYLFDADGNLLSNWLDILANPIDPPRG